MINRCQDGLFGTFRLLGIIPGSIPMAANTFDAGSTSTAITSRMISRNTLAPSANSSGDTRVSSSGPISERTKARSTARRHEL